MKLSEIMKNNTNISLATIDGEGKPRVRMFNHQFIVDGKICFATGNQNSTHANLQANPNAEIMQFSRGMYVRIAGEAIRAAGEERTEMLERLALANPRLIEMYTPEGFQAKMEVYYFINPDVRVSEHKTHTPIEVEIA